MKQTYFCLLLTMISAACFGQGWLWRKDQNSDKILCDHNKDLYVLKNLSPGFYIDKLNGTNGTVIRTIAASGDISAKVLRCDASNNLVVLANLSSTSIIGTTTLTPKGKQSFCILKFATDGTMLSANVYGSDDVTFANDLFITASGDYLIGGGYTHNFDVNGTTLGGDSLHRFFFLKMTSAEHVLWWERCDFTDPGEAFIDEITETSSGIIYMAFTFYGLISYKGYNFQTDGQQFVKLNSLRAFDWVDYLCYPGVDGNHYRNLQTCGDSAYMTDYFSWTETGDAKIFRWTPDNSQTYAYFPYFMASNIYDSKIWYACIGVDNQWQPTYNYKKIGSLRPNFDSKSMPYDSSVTSYGSYDNLVVATEGDLFLSGYRDGMQGNFVGRYLMSGTTDVALTTWEGMPLYPNPSEGIFILSGSEKCVSVMNAAGQRVDFKAEQNKVEVNAVPGIYFIEIADGKRTRKEKLVVQY